jgi:DNA-binding transcriptional LysR family regulator
MDFAPFCLKVKHREVRMETRRLKLFVEIVDSGSISRAAALLGMAQAALSQQLAILENELKAKLVNRTPSGIQVTPAGDSLYREAQIILRQLDRTMDCVQSLAGQISGYVSIGLTISSAALFAVPLLKAVKEAYPHIRLDISDGLSGDLTNRLIHGHLDLASLYRQECRAGITASPLMREEFALISSASQNLPSTMNVAELDQLPLLLPSGRQVLRPYYDGLFAERNIRPNIIAEIDSVPVLKSAILTGLGSTIHPPFLWTREIEAGSVRVTRIENADLDRTVWLCRASDPGSPEVNKVHDLIRSVTNKLLQCEKTIGLHPI